MKIDPKMMKEINKAVDGFVEKNKLALANAKRVEQLEKKVQALEKKIQSLEKSGGSSESNHSSAISKHDIRLTYLEAWRPAMVKEAKRLGEFEKQARSSLKFISKHDVRLTQLEAWRPLVVKELKRLDSSR